MKRVLLVVMLVGCGDDGGGGTADAFVMPGPEYNLVCLNNTVSTVPNPIVFGGTVVDHTTLAFAPIAAADIKTYTVQDDTMVGMALTDVDGKFSYEIATTGTPARIYTDVTAAGFVPSRTYVNIPPSGSFDMGIVVSVKQSRLDTLATALGATLDPTKGVLEVWANDCGKGELPGATVTVDGATATWAMFAGNGAWLPRATTVGHPNMALLGSVAGTVNVTPGVHTVTVTSGALVLGPYTVSVKANEWTVIHVFPGAL
jgi:hypothetical protein